MSSSSVLASGQTALKYYPKLNAVTGSVTATLLLCQINYWWHAMGRKPFYKFAAPCQHPYYKPGDSWQEELGFTRREYEGALKRIAIKIGTDDDKRQHLDSALVFYWTDGNRMTHWELNEPVFNRVLDEILTPDVQTANVQNVHQQGELMSKTAISDVENRHYIESENTTEITKSEITITAPCAGDAGASAPREKPKKKPKKPQSPDHPFQIYTALMETVRNSRLSKGPNLAAIKRLCSTGCTRADILGCAGWLKSQPFWRDKPVNAMTVEKNIDEWVNQGRPARAAPNGNGRGNGNRHPVAWGGGDGAASGLGEWTQEEKERYGIE
jgi:hypothetical protein